MSEENKDRLEEFFKNHTEKYHFEYNEADWDKLEAKLDKAEKEGILPPSKSNGRKYFIWGGLVLLLTLAVYFGLNVINSGGAEQNITVEKHAEAHTNADLEISSPVEDKQQQSGESHNTRHEPDKDDGSTYSSSELATSRVHANGDSRAVPMIGGGPQPSDKVKNGHLEPGRESGVAYSSPEQEDAQSAGLAKGNKRASSEGGGEPEEGMKNSDQASSDEFNGSADNAFISTTEKNSDVPLIDNIEGKHRRYMFLHILPYGIDENNKPENPEVLIFDNHTDIANSGKDLIKDPEKNDVRRLFSVGFVFAPDFSTVGLGDYTKPGTRYGLRLEYNLSKRFMLQTGVLLVDNVYNASVDQYNVPDEYWQGEERPDFANGECKIIDIPLNLRYNITNAGSNRFFVSGGVTSYIMLSERYEFTYAQSEYGSVNGANRQYSWRSDEATQHLFGLINLTAGYERFVATNWSIQAEPFINVPITGIGWGKVDLYSMGMYLSLKYHWNKK